ncbi:hypothetical protein KSD_81820 [Ktedonobacter sp. SOSP1-85]|nr:hypothetical protein KSD_81820 [Ktedonobacter sp. SOSP1-85]
MKMRLPLSCNGMLESSMMCLDSLRLSRHIILLTRASAAGVRSQANTLLMA